jgi:hypothetical protein
MQAKREVVGSLCSVVRKTQTLGKSQERGFQHAGDGDGLAAGAGLDLVTQLAPSATMSAFAGAWQRRSITKNRLLAAKNRHIILRPPGSGDSLFVFAR